MIEIGNHEHDYGKSRYNRQDNDGSARSLQSRLVSHSRSKYCDITIPMIETSMLVLAEFKTFCVKTDLLISRIWRQPVIGRRAEFVCLTHVAVGSCKTPFPALLKPNDAMENIR